MKISFLLMILTLLLLGCTGEESLGVDTKPPNKPELVPHIGDTGDGGNFNIPGANYYNTHNPDFENNGIDAVMEGDWIKIQWYTLTDSDIDYLRIFRFSAQEYYNAIDTLNFAQIIGTVNYEEQIHYVDRTSDTDKNYFYFIEAIDEAGNSTLSDTTGYKLIAKPILISPVDYSSIQVQNINDVIFEWLPSANAIQYKLLIFNENRELIWQNTLLDMGYFSVDYDGPLVDPGSTLTWRVDAFGDTYATPNPIEGNFYTVESGAESVERYIFITE